jgi:hypothetical protein
MALTISYYVNFFLMFLDSVPLLKCTYTAQSNCALWAQCHQPQHAVLDHVTSMLLHAMLKP